MHKRVGCDCGTEIVSSDDEELVALAIAHARRVHGMELARGDVLAQARPATMHGDTPPGAD